MVKFLLTPIMRKLVRAIKRAELTLVDAIISIACLGSGIYFMVKVLANIENGIFCPKPVICAENAFQITMLSISRFCAGVLYPLFFVIFFTKLAFLRAFLSKSFFSEIVDFSEFHQIHASAGLTAFIFSIIHSAAHIARLSNGDRASLIVSTNTGWSGVVGMSLLFLITLPMHVKILKTNVTYEIRKLIHYLSLPWLIILSFHTNLMAYILLSVLAIYCFDYLVSIFFLTFRVESANFEAVGNGVAVSFKLPPTINAVHAAGQYAYLNIPWISIIQWHAFSLMINEEENSASFFIMATGDFTEKLLLSTIAFKQRPILWIHGPHPSPFMHSVRFSKIVLIASGAGITPAISIIDQYHSQRQVYLIFITSDASLVKFFLPNLGKVRSTVFFTGSEEEFGSLQHHFESKFKSVHGFHVPGPDGSNERQFSNVLAKTNLQGLRNIRNLDRNDVKTEVEMSEIDTSVQEDATTLSIVENEERPLHQVDEVKNNDNKSQKEKKETKNFKLQESMRFLISGQSDKWANLVQGRPNIRREIMAIVRYESSMNVERLRTIISSKRGSLPHISFQIPREKEENTLQLASDLSEWSVLYCGASKALNKMISKVCEELDVNYTCEFFTKW